MAGNHFSQLLFSDILSLLLHVSVRQLFYKWLNHFVNITNIYYCFLLSVIRNSIAFCISV